MATCYLTDNKSVFGLKIHSEISKESQVIGKSLSMSVVTFLPNTIGKYFGNRPRPGPLIVTFSNDNV